MSNTDYDNFRKYILLTLGTEFTIFDLISARDTFFDVFNNVATADRRGISYWQLEANIPGLKCDDYSEEKWNNFDIMYSLQPLEDNNE